MSDKTNIVNPQERRIDTLFSYLAKKIIRNLKLMTL